MLSPTFLAMTSRSRASCECASNQTAVSTARRRSRARMSGTIRIRGETARTKRPTSSTATSSRPTLLLPSAAASASSPSTISSDRGGRQPIRQPPTAPPSASTSPAVKWKERHSSALTWSWVHMYSTPGCPTRIDPAASSNDRPQLRYPKLPRRTYEREKSRRSSVKGLSAGDTPHRRPITEREDRSQEHGRLDVVSSRTRNPAVCETPREKGARDCQHCARATARSAAGMCDDGGPCSFVSQLVASTGRSYPGQAASR